jgi:hypothetical protein
MLSGGWVADDDSSARIGVAVDEHRVVMYRATLTDGVFRFRDEYGDRLFTQDPTPAELRAMLRAYQSLDDAHGRRRGT